MIIDEHSVPLPADKLWPPFAASVDRVTREWDVLRRAVDEGWGEYDPLRCEQRLVEDLLLNFAMKWNDQKEVDSSQIDSFLVGTFEDFFDADIDCTATRLSKVLAKLYNEALGGIDRGIRYILNDEYDEIICHLKRTQASKDLEQVKAEQQVEVAELQSKMKQAVVVDEEGWSTVTRKR